MSSIKVAVRVRPFTEREILLGSKLCISMDGNCTKLINNEDESKSRAFNFDYSYWSHDGYEVQNNGYLAPIDPKYADQQKVFDDLGVELLNNAWAGYNTILFAYGQTGSGKSYSLVGYGANKGIFSRLSNDLFERINSNKDNLIQYEVLVSMFEIYNEKVHDLLVSSRERTTGGLRIRRTPQTGTIIQDLTKHKVHDFHQIDLKLTEGNNNKTIGATVMNHTSSRAHTVFSIIFKQTKFDSSGKPISNKISNINLVDLAGSERTGAMGATGTQLKEGTLINKSLSTLGIVFSLLADKSSGKLSPYRDSALTRILQDALSGNSKTIMIASISPAFDHFGETLSTLRYADRVKNIKTYAQVNENNLEKIIRDLKMEIERLKKCLKGEFSKDVQVGDDMELTENYKKELEENTAELAEMTKSWQEKLLDIEMSATKLIDLTKDDSQDQQPRIQNINEDPFLCGKLVFFIKEGINVIGRENNIEEPDILIGGAGIQKSHAVIKLTQTISDEKIIKNSCCIEAQAKTVVNGDILDKGEVRILMNQDRILFGNHNLFVFYDCKVKETSLPDWGEAMQEANQQYLGQMNSNKVVVKRTEDEENIFHIQADDSENRAMRLIQDIMTRTIVLIEEVNLIAEEMEKPIVFSIKLVTRTNTVHSLKDSLLSNAIQNTEILVCNHRLDKDIIQFWPLELFEQQVFEIRDLFSKWSKKNEDEVFSIENDPFETVPDSFYLIGNSYLFLDGIRNLICFKKEKFPILDYKGKKEGELIISIDINLKSIENLENDYTLKESDISTNSQENESIDDFNSIEDLYGRMLNIKLDIEEGNFFRNDYIRNLKIVYKWIDGTSEFQVNSETDNNKNPRFMHTNNFHLPINNETLNWFNGAIIFEVFGMASNTSLNISNEKKD